MTNSWTDIRNTDLVIIMGGNAAEAHPCGFKWVTEAKANRGAKLIVVDPRFTRSASVADVYAPIRQGTDIAFLLGVMSGHTANAGDIYFAAGTPDPNDIMGGAVDLESSVMRELKEETGIVREDVTIESGWTALPYGQRIALMKIVQARESAAVLGERIRGFLASQKQPELSDVHVVRGMDDLRPTMPPYVATFLASRLH